ncbi:MAG: class I SAM-dependent methyltransferase [Acidobacteriota bacterium]|nr:class I SAM-dependent methyltransferase [Acidobacteriota bacterium]
MATDADKRLALLDEAIAEVAVAEYRRLAARLSSREVSNRVNGALESLDSLKRGRQPNYDEWDALFYLTWYQPRHVHLIYTLLHHGTRDFPALSQVIDIGCGAGATQVALAFSMADQPSRSGAVDVSVHGIDPSRPMRAIGKALWLALRHRAERDPDLGGLGKVMADMSARCASYGSYEAYAASPSAVAAKIAGHPHWLTAVHAVYEKTKSELRRLLAEVSADREPEGILVTCDDGKEGLLDHVLEVLGGSLESRQIKPIWRGPLRCTTSWRRWVRADLDSPSELCRNYLKGQVRWDPIGNPIEKDVARVWGTQ